MAPKKTELLMLSKKLRKAAGIPCGECTGTIKKLESRISRHKKRIRELEKLVREANIVIDQKNEEIEEYRNAKKERLAKPVRMKKHTRKIIEKEITPPEGGQVDQLGDKEMCLDSLLGSEEHTSANQTSPDLMDVQISSDLLATQGSHNCVDYRHGSSGLIGNHGFVDNRARSGLIGNYGLVNNHASSSGLIDNRGLVDNYATPGLIGNQEMPGLMENYSSSGLIRNQILPGFDNNHAVVEGAAREYDLLEIALTIQGLRNYPRFYGEHNPMPGD